MFCPELIEKAYFMNVWIVCHPDPEHVEGEGSLK